MPVEKTRLRRSPQSSPTHRSALQTVTPRARIAGSPIPGGSHDTVHGTSVHRIRQLMLIRLPPPLFLIRFR